MAGDVSPNRSIASDADLESQFRFLFTYAEDRNAKVSLIQGILKNNQGHAIPAEIPRDLILEAKVRCGKRLALNKSPLLVPPKPSAPDCCDLLQVEDNIGSSLPSAVLNMEKKMGTANDSLGFQSADVLSADDGFQPNRDQLKGKEGLSTQSKMLIERSGQATKWSDFFTSPSTNSRELTLCQRPSDDPAVHVEFDEGDTLQATLNWGHALVGYFIGNSPSFFAIKSSLEKAWRVRDLEIITMSDGFYLFKFNNYDVGQAILDDGPWFVHGHPLVLRRWTEDMVMSKHTLETIPIWVRFPNLNFCFRTNSALSKIASVIGTPICMDHATAAGTRFAFARVCIEIGIDAELPSEIRMKFKGKTILQKVEYAWKPNPCRTCHTFDHGDKACPLKSSSRPKQVWVPKKIQSGILQGPVEGLVAHTVTDGGWTVVTQKKSPTKVFSRSDSPTKDGSSTSLDQVNRFSSLSTLGGDSTVSVEDMADDTGGCASGPPMDTSPKKAANSSTVEFHQFQSLSNLDGDSNVPDSELLATTALVIQGTAALSSHIKSDELQPSLSSIHQLDKSLLSTVPSSSSSARHKPKSVGLTHKQKATSKARST